MSPGRECAVNFLKEDEIFTFSGIPWFEYISLVQMYDTIEKVWGTYQVKENIPEPRAESCGEYFKAFGLFIAFDGRAPGDILMTQQSYR